MVPHKSQAHSLMDLCGLFITGTKLEKELSSMSGIPQN